MDINYDYDGYVRENKLTGWLFRVKIPHVATYSDSELSRGVIKYDTFNGATLHNSHNDLRLVMLPIDAILEKIEMGYRVLVVNQSDIADMYFLMDAYLRLYSDGGQYSLNAREEDKKTIDKIRLFSKVIFDQYSGVLHYGVMQQLLNNPFTKDLKDGFIDNTSTYSIGGNAGPISQAVRFTSKRINEEESDSVYPYSNSQISKPTKGY